MADDKNRVPLFDGTNFSNWKFRMEALLDEKDLLELVTELYSAKTEAKICEVNTELCFAGFAQGEVDSSWYLDSGCTEHLAKSSNSLKNVRPLEKPIQIRSAKSGTFLTAKEMGDIPVETVIEVSKSKKSKQKKRQMKRTGLKATLKPKKKPTSVDAAIVHVSKMYR
ncbi:hypothetical protein MTP99_015939 [Tenebrio molitor]|nr:hypothetical protein MTP99_015939 [Tenebrio molitor]